MQDAIRAKAKELNVNLVELDAQGKAENQMAHCENFLSRSVDAVILNPADQQGSAPALALVVQAHRPVVVVNSIVSNVKEAGAYVGSEDGEAGRIAAAEIMRRLDGKGQIVVIHGPYGHSAEVQRSEGIRKELAKYPQAAIVSEQTGGWDRAKSLAVMENWLSSGRKIDAVIAQNDEMALGAEEAIEAAGKQKQILVIGIDAIPDALRAVGAGKLAGTVFQDARGQGSTAVELAVALAQGKTVRKDNYLPFQLVTRDNLEKFLKP
jgi:inositol transport system substrate-binding protein